MAYSKTLAEKVRKYLSALPEFQVEEKTLMGGLVFRIYAYGHEWQGFKRLLLC